MELRDRILKEDGIDNKDAFLVHGCDGCCKRKDFPGRK